MAIFYAGVVIGYKTHYQDAIAQSSTEAEFADADAGHTIPFFRSLLNIHSVPQDGATVLFKDNCGTLLMANAQQHTHNTHHLDIKHFAILDWVQWDHLTHHDVSTNDNSADTFTKPLGKQLFH